MALNQIHPQQTDLTAVSAPTVRPVGNTPMGLGRAYQVLADNLPGFERRPEQEQLTAAMAKALASSQHLVAEAPTGTGKSFAVGLSYMAEMLGTGKTMVIATANNSLLEQYATKDLPFLQKIYPGFTWARAKGKNNYACLDKGEKLFGQQVLFGQAESLKQLQQWYDTTRTGDKEEITFQVKEEDWQKINADDSCTGKKCPFYDDCHYYKAKEQLYSANVIVTNFDLVLLSMLNPEIQIFPTFEALVLDEAHQLEDKAISKMEASLTERQIMNYIHKAQKSYGFDDEALLNEVRIVTVALFNEYRKLLVNGEEKKSIISSKKLWDLTEEFKKGMNTLHLRISQFKTPPNSRERQAQLNIIESICKARNAAEAAIKNTKRYVSWVEQTKNDIKVVTCPFRVAKELYQSLFSNPDMTVVCLSATMSANGGKKAFTMTSQGVQPALLFEQFRNRVGLPLAAEFICPSPFDYRKNCVTYIPTPPQEALDPNSEEWRRWMRGQILDLVKLSKGRAFVLTTSTKACREIGDYLAKMSGLPVKAQSPDFPNSKLIEWFKHTPNSIIVATSSFWQGVSIEGDDLKLVIIDKIPFTSHTEPIQQARDTWYKNDPDKKSKAFMDLQVYPAIIQLKQGYGRLIRTKSDTGAVALLDPRLTTARYKSVILNSLPAAPKVDRLDDPRLVNILK